MKTTVFKALCSARGMTAEELARATGYSASFIRKVWRGNRRPSPQAAYCFSGALRISVETLFSDRFGDKGGST